MKNVSTHLSGETEHKAGWRLCTDCPLDMDYCFVFTPDHTISQVLIFELLKYEGLDKHLYAVSQS